MKTVYLISGKINSGKNQLADFFKEELESRNLTVRTDLFAKDLKDGCKDDFNKLAYCLHDIRNELKNSVDSMFDVMTFGEEKIQSFYKIINKLVIQDKNWYEDKTDITRHILQLYGTEIFRNRVDGDWWPKKVQKRLIESDQDVTLVTDTRFPNEITVINDHEFEDLYRSVSIRIERSINTNRVVAQHSSETALDKWAEWDYIVENNGTLEELRQSATTIVNDILDDSEKEYEEMELNLIDPLKW